MANVFEKPDKFAATALAVLRKEIKGAGLFVHKFGRSDFVGAKDDTINIKRPPILKAYDAGFRNRNARQISEINQSSIKVSLSRFPTSEVALTPEEETLDEVNYVRDVQAPQVRALVEDFDESIAETLRDADFVFEVTFHPDPDGTLYQNDPRKVARRGKRLLDSANVPSSGRYWLVGAAVSEAIAGTKGLLEVDKAGVPETLRDGVVGRLAGFTIVDWPSLEEDESYFVHETAVALATVAPVVPNGAKAGATIAAQGLAVTQLWDYDPEDKSDHSTVHTFTGTALVTDPQEVVGGGEFVTDDKGKPQFEFIRGIRVIFVEEGAADDIVVNGSAEHTLTVTGAPTGGTFSLLVDGTETGPIAHNASNAAVAEAINAVQGVAGAKVSGGVFPANPKTVELDERVSLARGDNNLTGGTSPDVTVTAV